MNNNNNNKNFKVDQLIHYCSLFSSIIHYENIINVDIIVQVNLFYDIDDCWNHFLHYYYCCC